MLAVRLEKQLEAAITRIAEATGSTKSSVVREAVVRYLEDREDIMLAEQARQEVAWPGRLRFPRLRRSSSRSLIVRQRRASSTGWNRGWRGRAIPGISVRRCAGNSPACGATASVIFVSSARFRISGWLFMHCPSVIAGKFIASAKSASVARME